MREWLAQYESVTFAAPQYFSWTLALLLLVGVSLFYRTKRGVLGSILQVLAVLLLIVSLADPIRRESHSSTHLAALIDVSHSVSKNAQRALIAESLKYLRAPETTLQLLPFAASAIKTPLTIRAGTAVEEVQRQLAEATSALDTGETNLAEGISTLASQTSSSSLLLLSDGFETTGNARAAAQQVANKGIHIYPVLPSRALFGSEKVSISSLHAPVTANSGERVEIRTSVRNTFSTGTRAELELWLDEKKLLSQHIQIPAGQERLLRIQTPPLTGGLKRMRAVLLPEGSSAGTDEIERHRWISVKEKAKILLLNGTADDQRILKELLQLKGYGLESIIADGRSTIPTAFSGYSSVILNNIAREQLPGTFLSTLKTFVEGGGGLLLLGGERSFGLGGYVDTPLDEVSPLKFIPPQTKKRRLTVAVVFVMDKSGSMAQENKIEAAKQAALISIEALKDEDQVGVIGFDHAPFVIIDLQQVAAAKINAARRLENLTAAGQTNLLPALSAARAKLRDSSASRKHIIVLSDGKFPLSSDTYVEEINRLRQDGVSVSAVALGIEADVPFMKLLSKYGKGAFYHTLDPQQLPQIFVQDIKVSTGELTMKEDQLFTIGLGPAGVQSVTLNRFPPLKGFVETLPKKGSALELLTKKGDKIYPILGSWTFGKGRVVAFTSDANGRWSLPWLRWPDFPVFWTQLTESVKNRSDSATGEIDFDLRYSVNRKAITLDLAVFDDKLRTQSSPKIQAQVVDPGGETRLLSFRPLSKGRFQGLLEKARPGDYRLQIDYGSVRFPALAITIGGESFGEVPGRGVNLQNLEELAAVSGGKVNPDPASLPVHTRLEERDEHLFPPLVVTAFFLMLLAAFARELRGRQKQAISAEVRELRRPQGRYTTKRAA